MASCDVLRIYPYNQDDVSIIIFGMSHQDFKNIAYVGFSGTLYVSLSLSLSLSLPLSLYSCALKIFE